MATVRVAGTDTAVSDPEQVAELLAPLGIWHECWPVEGRIGPDATDAEILDAYAPEIERLKERGGYVTADVINVTPETPGLDTLIAKFDKEHTHSEDEVRFTVRGHGVFWVNPGDGSPVLAIDVTAGDLINVPAGTRHWFHLCSDRTIRCIRLFEDATGWTPEYLEDHVHEGHAPVCWGPRYVEGSDGADIKPAVEI
ncbi:Acireductone dioxygenase [Pseudobythopirellula maris]|uniref:Acireductone dioxygenase n=1 Tax=Pseudobythopirellula maris TaxID=2527991 RepID=A0A5C5ZGF7_9BACT|nr:cupin domain-containing protein [Pseudobythopirellula maris]TWT86210.1 Acireductone dioxygenase [Pseudobythopirellula maris]